MVCFINELFYFINSFLSNILLWISLWSYFWSTLFVKAASLLFWFVIASTYFLSCSSIVFVCFSNAFPNGEYVNLPCSVICLWLEGNNASHVRFFYYRYFQMIMVIFLLFLSQYYIIVFHLLSCHQLSWLVFVFFLKDSFWNMNDYPMQE